CPARLRPALLAIVSILFYAVSSAISAGVLLIAALAVFAVARYMDQMDTASLQRRLIFTVALVVLLAYLLFIKLLPDMLAAGTVPSSFTHTFLALGVSYYTFKLMGYLIDVYWRKYPAWSSPVEFVAFASFFPQLPAGPIQRANEFKLPRSSIETSALMRAGLRRILLGIVKKTVLADQLASIISYIDGMQPHYSNMLWFAAILYALELYFDFAALTDIAVGTAGLFGIRSPENFAHPYFAPSISQFWRRWHMSLTFWLTDYVFTPLRMATRNLGNWGLALSITANMVLIGLWHGINIGFLLFGVIQSIYLMVDSFTSAARKRFYRKHRWADVLTNLIGPFFVFLMIAFTLVFFRAGSFVNISYELRHLWDGLESPVASVTRVYYGFGRMHFGLTGIAVTAALVLELCSYLRAQQSRVVAFLPSFSSLPLAMRWAVYYAALATVITLHQQSTHFIYVQF
ncbi:MAG TPA: MBOAT family O-acyltransferase, partial [Pseudacidobacterium sp.]|nr:MBOAT family O-acyltransferase [Pseudacidobacterium sp.]